MTPPPPPCPEAHPSPASAFMQHTSRQPRSLLHCVADVNTIILMVIMVHKRYKSDTIMNNLNPVWASFKIGLTELCNGDTTRPIKIYCYDWDSNGDNDLIGYTDDLTVDG